MSHSYNHNEPLKSPENQFFSGVIAFYFSPFFFEHPVYFFKDLKAGAKIENVIDFFISSVSLVASKPNIIPVSSQPEQSTMKSM